MKILHNPILKVRETLKGEHRGYNPIPVVREVVQAMVQRNYTQIRQYVEDLVTAEMERIMNYPGIAGLVLKENGYY